MSTPIRTAVILAAGTGTRLKARGTLIPKGFLRFNDVPIVERSIAQLVAAGIERIVIVTGHLDQFYEDLRSKYSALVTTRCNPDYARSGSMYSLYCARDLLDEDFLLLESDILYQSKALPAVLESPHQDIVLMSGITGQNDAVFVETRAGKLVNMSKSRELLGPDVAGELVGVTRVSQGLFAKMIAVVEEWIPTTLQIQYETDCLVAAARRHPVYCDIVEDLAWIEIDDEEDLRVARDEVFPRIESRDRALILS